VNSSQSRTRRSPAAIVILAALFVAGPLLTWQQTWFGRKLTDAQMLSYLQDERHPRHMQHALSQISDRILQGDTAVRQWYPQVVSLAHHSSGPVRVTSAWVLGQDNTSDLFHQTLLTLLQDSDPMVRRNAALALVRFHDARGRPELRSILDAYTFRSPVAGRVAVSVAAHEKIGTGTLLARVTPQQGRPVEIRSLFVGEVGRILARDGSNVSGGEGILSVNSGEEQVWEALRGLYLIGGADDLDSVQRYASVNTFSDSLRKQAESTAQAIRARLEPTTTR
jgi:HEAT repeats